MNIEKYNQEVTPDLFELLLTADPSSESIASYLKESKILVCRDQDKLLGVAVTTEKDKVFELKNIAVLTAHQGKGIAKALIAEIKKLSKKQGGKVLEVGTGNSSLPQLALYQKCGFRMFEIDTDYFESYPNPIFENGIRCIDRVRLRLEL